MRIWTKMYGEYIIFHGILASLKCSLKGLLKLNSSSNYMSYNNTVHSSFLAMDHLNGKMTDFGDIEVSRTSVVLTLLKKYDNPIILGRRLHVVFEDEIGIDDRLGDSQRTCLCYFGRLRFNCFSSANEFSCHSYQSTDMVKHMPFFPPLERSCLHGIPCETEYMLTVCDRVWTVCYKEGAVCF